MDEPTLPGATHVPWQTDGHGNDRPYLENKKGVLADALFNPAILDTRTLYTPVTSYWQDSQMPPLRMASMEHAFFSASVYVGLSVFSGFVAFSTVAFSMLEAPRVRR